MKRRMVVLALALVILLSLAACGSGTPSATQTSSTPSGTSAGNDNSAPPDSGFVDYDGEENLMISETPITITLFSTFGAGGAPTPDLAIWQEASKITNVSIENVANPSMPEEPEALSQVLAGGTLPDIMYAAKDQLASVISQGGMIDMSDLIAQYAPNILRYFDTIPEARVSSTNTDGKVYFIDGTLSPTFERKTKLIPTMEFFIRKDWLDTLGLPIPTTLEDFKNTLYAFRNNDPNGNSQKDEIPFFYRDGSPVGLYQLFGIDGDWAIWSIDPATDKVIHGRVSENYKNALRELAQWYKDGVLDSELLTRGSQARQELLSNNTGGCTFDWLESTSKMQTNEDILAQVPDIEWVAFLPPADVNGEVKTPYSQAPVSGWVWGISKDCEDPVSVIKFMDFWFTRTGAMLCTYGIEGQSYTMEDGKPQYSEEATSYGGGIPNYLRTLGVCGMVNGIVDVDISDKPEETQVAYRLYYDSDVLRSPFPVFNFTEAEDEARAEYAVQVDTKWQEYEQQVLYGEKDVDATWAGYIAEMNQLGLQEMLAIMNAAYDRYKAQFGY